MDPLPDSPEPPHSLRERYAAWDWTLVSQNDARAATYRLLGPAGEAHYLKVAHDDAWPTIEAEAARTRWAAAHLPVPPILARGSENPVSWLLTRGLPGQDATDPRWRGDVARLVEALAIGLRRFHDAAAAACPFDFRLDAALALARRRLLGGLILPERDLHPEFAHLSPPEALAILERTRPTEQHPVVCHGDYCLPNLLLEDWVPTGYVDLGALGVADRWWDLAVATWSLAWNLGPGHEERFLSVYGTERDDARMAYYRLLYDLVS